MAKSTPEHDQFIFDVFVTSMEDGGYAGWRTVVSYRWETPTKEYDLTGFMARIRDEEDDTIYTVGRATIVHGLNVINKAGDLAKLGLADSYVKTIAGATRVNDASDIDVELADFILQAGLFGEIIYG